jgi:hypothetical protein
VGDVGDGVERRLDRRPDWRLGFGRLRGRPLLLFLARVSWRVRARAPKGHSAKLVVGFLLESLLTLYHDDLF